MEIFEQQSVDVIQAELADRQRQMAQLTARKEVLQADLSGYDTAGYEYFKNSVLAKEKVRIAMVRMTVEAGKTDLHERLQGQFNEVEMLMRNKEAIQRELAGTERVIADVAGKITRLKKQIEKRIKR
jgi:hypothetical protein